MSRDVHIAPRFEEMFPAFAKRFRALHISVWMPFKAGRKKQPQFETVDGIPYFTAGVDSSVYQLTFKYLKGGESHFTREHFEKQCHKILREVRKGRKEIAGETLAQRYARLRAKVADAKLNVRMSADSRAQGGFGGGYVETSLHPSGDTAVIWWRYGDIGTVQLSLFGYGQILESRDLYVGIPRQLSFTDMDQKFAAFEASQKAHAA